MPASTFILTGDALAAAVRMHDDGVPQREASRRLGVAVSTLQNGVAAALCARSGHAPAQRTPSGRLSQEGRDRLREALRKGLKGVEIQLRLGVAAGTVSKERKRYAADLKARGKRCLPPPGGGDRYRGVLVPKEKLREVEELLLTGMGAGKAALAVGISKTPCLAVRRRLVRRLARRGETLPGCDRAGRRTSIIFGDGHVPAASKAQLRDLLLAGMPVANAAKIAVVCARVAYAIRDELNASRAAAGLPAIIPCRLSRDATRKARIDAEWLPKGRSNKVLYRRMLEAAGGDFALARRATVKAMAERDGHDPHVADQIDRMRRGAGLVAAFSPRRMDSVVTLGGVASSGLS